MRYGMFLSRTCWTKCCIRSCVAARIARSILFSAIPGCFSCGFYRDSPQGSSWAHRPVGRLGSALVETSAESESVHTQLVHDNPNLFREELIDRFPSSVDLLKPASLLLAATTNLPCSPAVRLHTIYGVSKTTWEGEPADGVVPVAIARLLGVASEREIRAKHAFLHRQPGTISELVRLLPQHKVDGCQSPS